jgi:type VI secretion system protein ImpA
MPTPECIDVQSLIAAISDDNPTGEELTSMSASFEKIKSTCTTSKTNERKIRELRISGGEDSDEMSRIDPPDWKSVQKLATEILTKESKDLRVAAWLIEALLRNEGFAGIRDGLFVFKNLCEKYWDNIHPRPTDDDGHMDTVAQFNGFAGEASLVPLSEIPITGVYDGQEFNSIDYTEAAELDSVSDASTREDRIQNGAVSFEQLENAVRKTPGLFYVDLVEDLGTIESTLNEISDFLDLRCLPDGYGEPTSPSVSGLRNKISEIKGNVEGLARAHLELAAADAEADAENAGDGQLITTSNGEGNSQKAAARMATGNVISRDDAFEALRKVADYFERTEPHSPVSYALRQVVNWGTMSLPDLLAELIEDSSVLKSISKRIGMPVQESDDGY